MMLFMNINDTMRKIKNNYNISTVFDIHKLNHIVLYRYNSYLGLESNDDRFNRYSTQRYEIFNS